MQYHSETVLPLKKWDKISEEYSLQLSSMSDLEGAIEYVQNNISSFIHYKSHRIIDDSSIEEI